jgi:hypothetical protein
MIAGTAGSNPDECMDVRLLCLFYVLRRADDSFRGVLCGCVCLIVFDV